LAQRTTVKYNKAFDKIAYLEIGFPFK